KTIQSALEMYFTKEGGYPISNPAGECLGDGNPIRVAMQKDGDVIVKVPTDPIWEDIEPALFNNNIQKDYPIGPSNSFCYWYNGKADSYYLSYYLESDSKAGTPGIHVQSINN
ncbi:MAG: hypothetical protein NT091_03455, partial [Candidatus Falkowbacteria bacterium]|nr:hypothetical protein [Candidatus Falkowbacteria bacterium]